MAQTFSTEMAGYNQTPVVKPTVAAYGGRLRRYRASITLALQAAADTVVLARIPTGSVFAFGIITTDTSLGATTVAVGTAASAALYKAAATFTALNTPTFFGNVTPIADQVGVLLDTIVLLTWAAATAPAAGQLCVDLYFSQW